MSASHFLSLPTSTPVINPGVGEDPEQWFAIQTRARHEKVVEQRLRDKGVVTFLPLVKVERQWSDRRKIVDMPLFSCYVFAKFPAHNDHRLRVLVVDGVVKLVGSGGRGAPIPEAQIEAVEKLMQEQLPYSVYPFLKIGQRVRIRSGALTGVEGILLQRSGERTLVVSIDAIQRSLAVRIEGYNLESL